MGVQRGGHPALGTMLLAPGAFSQPLRTTPDPMASLMQDHLPLLGLSTAARDTPSRGCVEGAGFKHLLQVNPVL